MVGNNRQVSVFVDADLHDLDANYSISSYDDDPNSDMKLIFGVGQEASVSMELTNSQAAQLAVDLLAAGLD